MRNKQGCRPLRQVWAEFRRGGEDGGGGRGAGPWSCSCTSFPVAQSGHTPGKDLVDIVEMRLKRKKRKIEEKKANARSLLEKWLIWLLLNL